MKDKRVLERMEKFSEMMFALYSEAEVLRDCTESGVEKEIFNKTRTALYELKYEARKLNHKWSEET